MAKTLKYIEELVESTLMDLSKKDNWIEHLKTASHLYKYTFFDSMLTFAQKPDATAVASYDLWNGKLHRYINRNAEGIALLQTNSRKSRLKYVFDISDTHGDRMPYIWQLKSEFEDNIADDLAKQFDVNVDGRFENTISNIVDTVVEDNISEYFNELANVTENSFLEEIDELNLSVWYRDLLKESVNCTVLLRCGYNIDEISSESKFSNLYNFNTPETMIQLGKGTSDVSQIILREVEKSVKRIEKEQRIERRKSNDRIQTSGELQSSQPANQGARRAAVGQIRHDEKNIPGKTPKRTVSDDVAVGATVHPLPQSGAGNTSGDRQANIADETQHRPEPMDDTLNRNRTAGNTGDRLQEIDEQADIDTVLLNGSGFEGGKQRIVDFYAEEHTSKEKAHFLKDEYGTGGRTEILPNDRTGYSDHDAKGVEIHSQGFDNPSIKLTWAKVAKRIGEIIDNGRYFEQRFANEKPLIKPTKQNSQMTLFDIAEQAEKTIQQAVEYGYTWDGMTQVDNDEAIRLLGSGLPVYLLHDDNTEALLKKAREND